MIEVRRITEYAELDAILPLIQKLHEMIESPYPFSAFIGYVVMQLKNPFQGIWVGYEEGHPIAYAILSIQAAYFELECCLVDAYVEKIALGQALTDEEKVAVDQVWDLIQMWAKENGCKRMCCITKRDVSTVNQKYGWEPKGTQLVKDL